MQGDSILAVAGEVDSTAIDALTCASDALGAHSRIDLSKVSFMDSSGIAWLLATKTSAEVRNGTVTLISPSQTVFRLLQVCGLTEVFEIICETRTHVSEQESPTQLC